VSVTTIAGDDGRPEAAAGRTGYGPGPAAGSQPARAPRRPGPAARARELWARAGWQHDFWFAWPEPDVVGFRGMRPARRKLGVLGRFLALGIALWDIAHSAPDGAVDLLWLLTGTTLGLLAFSGFLYSARRCRLGGALAAAGVLLTVVLLLPTVHGDTAGGVLLCLLGFLPVQRLPLIWGLGTGFASILSASLLWSVYLHGYTETALALKLLACIFRQDRETRAAGLRMVEQERATHAAEGESAALAERGRIAREIHDVLAHSLSAQLVHLEAARLMLDSGADHAQVRERVVAARRMAQDGLEETRHALSALRGDIVAVGEYLGQLAQDEGAHLVVEGTPRPVPAEAGQALRRTAQEALTNIRKHAPGARTRLTLRYLGPPALWRGEGARVAEDRGIQLEIRNGVPAGPRRYALADSGSGYGLLGMRERAELLGGTLEAGPQPDGGYLVRLHLPA